jgi:replicative DNA helicase
MSAERDVIGSMLRENAVIGDVLQILREEDFYSDAHRKIFSAIVRLYDQGKPVDLTTLAEELRGHIEDIGGYPYIGELWNHGLIPANVLLHAQIVQDDAKRRRLQVEAERIAQAAKDGRAPVAELLEAAESSIADIVQMGRTSCIVSLGESIRAFQDTVDARFLRRQSGISGLTTGFAQLDEKLAGLHPGELIVIAARPSVGKTQLALSIGVRHVAFRLSQPVFFATLEQAHVELTERLIAAEARIDLHDLRRGTIDAAGIQALLAASDQLQQVKLFYDDSPGQTMQRVAANARRLKLRENIQLVMLDYIGLIESEKQNKARTRQEEVASVSRRLKNLARELKIPVIAMSQLNREAENRPEPRLSDLRDSGAVEQDADVVLLLHRPNDAPDIIKVNVAKQRNGPTGEIELTFDRRFGRFADCLPDIPIEATG